jgi:hypothetical protein
MIGVLASPIASSTGLSKCLGDDRAAIETRETNETHVSRTTMRVIINIVGANIVKCWRFVFQVFRTPLHRRVRDPPAPSGPRNRTFRRARSAARGADESQQDSEPRSDAPAFQTYFNTVPDLP